MASETSEIKLIEECIKGKRRAQSKLYKKYAKTLLGICLRYSRNKSEAEDVLQEGFIKIFMKIKEFRKEGSFEGWMKRIMVNTALLNSRDNLKHYFHADISKLQESISEDTIFEVDDTYSAKEIMNLVQGLPDGYRIVFNLYVFDNYTHKEIAELLGISEGTSKSQLSRARKFLQNKLQGLTNKKRAYTS